MLGTDPIIDVARYDYDLTDGNLEDRNKAFSSDRNTPKIYKGILVQRPDGTPLSSDYTITIAHNLGYIPRFWFMIELWGLWCHAGDLRANYGSNTFSYVTVDSTNFYITLTAYTSKLQLFCMFDPILATTENAIELPNYPFVRVADTDHDVETDHPRHMRVDSLWNMPRIVKSGQLSITAEAETSSYGSYHEVTYEHGLSYVPYFLPRIANLINLTSLYDGFSNIPSTVDLNSLTDATIAGDADMEASEIIYVTVDDTEIKIAWWRENVWFPDDFPERTITLDYLLFELALDEEFNLLLN